MQHLYTDDQLIEKFLNGDSEAFTTLVVRYHKRVYSFLFHLTLSKEDAEDLTQNTFIRIYKSIYKFHKGNSFLPWAYKIALNTYRDFYSVNKNKISAIPLDDLPEHFLGADDDSSFIMEQKESIKEILLLMNELKNGQREAFILKFGKDLSFREIGEILGISETAARMKYFRAKETLVKIVSKSKKRSV